jgi:hypothetical protein
MTGCPTQVVAFVYSRERAAGPGRQAEGELRQFDPECGYRSVSVAGLPFSGIR